MKINPDDPAFPNTLPIDQAGVPIRLWLAAQAMQGLLSQHLTQECESGNRDLEPLYFGGKREDQGKVAKAACRIADALIAEYNRDT